MFHYLSKKKFIFILYLLVVPMTAVTSVIFSKSLQPLLDVIYTKDQQEFIICSIVVVSAGIIDMAVGGLGRTIRERLRCEFVSGLRKNIFAHILGKSIPDYNEQDTSYYMNVLTHDTECMSRSYFDSVCGIYRVIVTFLITMTALLTINPYIAVLNLIVGMISVNLPRLFEKKLQKAQNTSSETSEEYVKKMKDYLSGFSTIKLFHIQKQISEKMETSNRQQTKKSYQSFLTNYWVSWISILCSVLSYVFTLVIGVWLVIKGDMTAGSVLAISQMIGGIAAPFEELPAYITELKSIKDLKEKILTIAEQPAEEKIEECEKTEKCDIVLENVSYSYDGETNQLDSINYHFKPEKKYVLVGESGSGKSTLAKSIMGFYPKAVGEIKINEKNIKDYSQAQLYHLMNYMQQNVFIFSDTLYHNITLYQEYDEKQIEQVLKMSGLDEFVEKLPEGLHTTLSEDGGNISGGERQRIGLARTLLTGAKYIIFDETTASLDVLMENKIENTILNLKDIGSIVITHRLNPNLLEKCDEILVLKDGRLVESGSFAELIEKKKYFYSFYTVNHSIEENE